MRTVPGNGLIVANGRDRNLTACSSAAAGRRWNDSACAGGWNIDADNRVAFQGEAPGPLKWELIGEHNRMNALAAIAAARHAGVPVAQGIDGIERIQKRQTPHGSARRRQRHHRLRRLRPPPHRHRHHLAGLRAKVGSARILAVLEPRSNTMKLGVMKDALPASLEGCRPGILLRRQPRLGCSRGTGPAGRQGFVKDNLDELIAAIVAAARPGDHILVMSNGGFGGIHEKLLQRLAGR